MVCGEVYNRCMQTENGEGAVNDASENSSDNNGGQKPDTTVGWKFNPSNSSGGVTEPASTPHPSGSVSWTASEYVAHHKSILWFIALGLVVAGLALGIYFVTEEIINGIVIVVIGLSFGVFGARQPKVLEYALDEKGLHISGKLYPYDRIKSFAIIDEGAISSILLMPLQRFMPPLSIYYDHDDETKIINVISSYIPHEEHEPDFVDRLMSKIRF